MSSGSRRIPSSLVFKVSLAVTIGFLLLCHFPILEPLRVSAGVRREEARREESEERSLRADTGCREVLFLFYVV